MKRTFPILIVGVVLAILIGSGIIYLTSLDKTAAPPNESFLQSLRAFDEAGTGDPVQADRTLDKLERRAFGLESKLSILKRRRALALQDSRYIDAYHTSASRAISRIPGSELLNLLLSESILLKEPVLSDQSRKELYTRAGNVRTTERAFDLYALSGVLSDPEQASVILHHEWNSGQLEPEWERDLAVLHILNGATKKASEQLDRMTQGEPDPQVIQLAGRFFYDYGQPEKAAKLLSSLFYDENVELQADALYLSGLEDSARDLWKTLTMSLDPSVRIRSRYNLATTTNNPAEALNLLEQNSADLWIVPDPNYRRYTTILQTRLLDPPRAFAVLEEMAYQEHSPLIDLEYISRRQDRVSVDKTVAELWLLLNRYPEEESLYEWAAFFFEYQKRPAEMKILLEHIDHKAIEGAWVDMYHGLRALQENRLNAAGEYFEAIPAGNAPWQVTANRARILEQRSQFQPAIVLYQDALASTKNPAQSAKILIRISRCFSAMGWEEDARVMLKRARETDPDSLIIRLETQRLISP
ncbi:hypothetical protein FACS1894164_01520 [Spirochaetia bacterium]|nr:hypothetical protein FACS1894164_01520 [Spirochaetia bacterium]